MTRAALPVLAVLGLKARDIMGYTSVVLVITGVVFLLDGCLDAGERAAERRSTVVGGIPLDAEKLVGPAACEGGTHVLLIVGENVDAESSGFSKLRPTRRRLRRAEREQRGIERYRDQGLAGEAQR